jgi:hypothetical protein
MIKLLAVLLLIAPFSAALCQSNVPNYPQRTAVQISELHDQKTHLNVFVKVEAAHRDSQVLLFLRYEDRLGFHLAPTRPDEPPLPRTRDALPDRSSSSRSLYKSTWFMNVATPSRDLRPREIYAVVTELRPKYSSERVRDVDGLERLPFARAQDITEVMLLLQDFGWTPTGFTRAAP